MSIFSEFIIDYISVNTLKIDIIINYLHVFQQQQVQAFQWVFRCA